MADQDQGGYYDEQGNWIDTSGGYYDEQGNWVDGGGAGAAAGDGYGEGDYAQEWDQGAGEGDWPQWSEVWDPESEQYYYYNNNTGACEWTKPADFDGAKQEWEAQHEGQSFASMGTLLDTNPSHEFRRGNQPG